MLKDSFDFGEVLRPLSLDTFFDEHWERKPLHIERGDPHFYDGLFSAGDVDALLAQSRPRYPQIRVVGSGKPPATSDLVSAGWLNPVLPSHVADAKVTPLYGAYSDGYTIIVELEKLWRPVSMFCRRMDELLHHKATAELYLTPAGAQGFDLHFDHHEVFVLQIAGSKHWQVHAPVTQSPTTEERVSPAKMSGPPLIEATVRAGDLLYIPRGCPHQGVTTDEYSLHITFGVFVYRWYQLVTEALKELSERDVRFRQALPRGFVTADHQRGFIRERLSELLRTLADEHDADTSLERLSTGYLRKLEPIPDGHFLQMNLLDKLTIESRVEKRVRTLCYVSQSNGTATIHFPGNFVESPSWVAPALRFIRDEAGPFTVGSLPDDLDEPSKLLLVRRLVKEGLLRVVGA